MNQLMMKAFAAMVKHKKEKDDLETAIESALGHSYGGSSREYIAPLVSYVVQGEQNP